MVLALCSPLLSKLGLRHGFSLRTGGVSEAPFSSLNLARTVGDDASAVAENHLRFASAVGYAVDRLYEVSQIHGAAVERVDPAVKAEVFRAREADALVTCEPGTAAGVRVADCVPVLLACPRTGAVAAVHAGWRGVVGGVVPAGVAALSEHSKTPASGFVAAIGPHIGPSAFEVSAEVAREIADSASEDPGVIEWRKPRPHANLERAVIAQLLRAGLSRSCIDRVPGCTFTERERFFSFRRDAARSGRHLAVIVAGC